MKVRHISTTYMWVPIIALLPVIYSMMVSLINNIDHMQYSLIAYSECSNKMIDYAFQGKVFNFSKCYVNTLKSLPKEPICKIDGDKIICEYNDSTYVFYIQGLENLSNPEYIEQYYKNSQKYHNIK